MEILKAILLGFLQGVVDTLQLGGDFGSLALQLVDLRFGFLLLILDLLQFILSRFVFLLGLVLLLGQRLLFVVGPDGQRHGAGEKKKRRQHSRGEGAKLIVHDGNPLTVRNVGLLQ